MEMLRWRFLVCVSLLSVVQSTTLNHWKTSELTATEDPLIPKNLDKILNNAHNFHQDDRLLSNEQVDGKKSTVDANVTTEERLFGFPSSLFGGLGGMGSLGSGLGSVGGIPTLSVANPLQGAYGPPPYQNLYNGGFYPYPLWPRPRPVYRNYNYRNYRSQRYYNSQAAWARNVAYHNGRLPNPFEYFLSWLGIRTH